MNTCPNCGKVAGLHSSILQGCMCQYSMQVPPQRTWVGLTDEDWKEIEDMPDTFDQGVAWAQAKLKEKNT
jgi:hypothetical protein